MGAKYYFKKCLICGRPVNGADQPYICNRCTAEGWIKSPDPDPEKKFGLWKSLWYLITYKPYMKVSRGLTKK
jgi:hypothetical protein